MSIIAYLLYAMSFGIATLVLMRSCAEKSPIMLSKGLVVSLIMAVVGAIMMLAGAAVANGLTFGIDNIDNLVFVGLNVVVALRILFQVFRNQIGDHSFDISRWGTVCALAVASSVNVFVIGLGIGFKAVWQDEVYKILIPTFLLVFLASYFAIMFGRQKVQMKSRRWMMIAVLFILIATLQGALR